MFSDLYGRYSCVATSHVCNSEQPAIAVRCVSQDRYIDKQRGSKVNSFMVSQMDSIG